MGNQTVQQMSIEYLTCAKSRLQFWEFTVEGNTVPALRHIYKDTLHSISLSYGDYLSSAPPISNYLSPSAISCMGNM